MAISPIQLKRIPLIVVLWETAGFLGRKRTFPVVTETDPPSSQLPSPVVMDRVGTLEGMHFDNTTYAIGIHEGPDYSFRDQGAGATVSFFADEDFTDRELVLPPGVYEDLVGWGNFDGIISSWKYNPPGTRPPGVYDDAQHGKPRTSYEALKVQPAALIRDIPLVVQLFLDAINGWDYLIGYPSSAQVNMDYITLVETSHNLGAEFGDEFDQKARAAVVWMGPKYDRSINPLDNWYARLYGEPFTDDEVRTGQEPDHLDLSPWERWTTDPAVQVAGGVFDGLNIPRNHGLLTDFNNRTRAYRPVKLERTLG